MYLHKTKNEHYTPPCCYFSGELEVVEILRAGICGKNSGYYRLPKFFRAHLYFIYRYYIKLGFLDGPEGKIFHFLQAYWYRFLVDAKIYECEKKGIKMEQQGALEAIPSNRGGQH